MGRSRARCGLASTVTSLSNTMLSRPVQTLKHNLDFVPTGAKAALNERLAHGLPAKDFLSGPAFFIRIPETRAAPIPEY